MEPIVCGHLTLEDIIEILVYCQSRHLKEKAVNLLITMVTEKGDLLLTLVEKPQTMTLKKR
jgi:hypothetical protein